MAINLSRPARQVDLSFGEYPTMLDNLQANILASHGRNHARHLFIRFTGDRAAVRNWIRTRVAPDVTSAGDQRRQSEERAKAKDEGTTFDGGLVTGFFLSAAGYAYLGLDPKKLPSTAFLKGMKNRDKYIGPELALGVHLKLRNRDPAPAQWEAGFQGEIHALLTLADDEVNGDLSRLTNKVQQHQNDLNGIGTVTHVQDGRVLRRPIPEQPGRFEPIEHFGYFDGISQPLFTGKELKDYDKDQGRDPPQSGDWDPAASLDLVLTADPFATVPNAYGSFLVYRKLEQDYDLFHERVAALADEVDIPPYLAGAYVVGRFVDGTPLTAGQVPSIGLEVDNHFMHSSDKKGLKCPMHAHIRKANPRGTTPKTTLKEEAARRIARRGIPYGKPHPDIKCDPNEYESQDAGPRGLVFMCYQANIENHFEFIQRVWVDNNEFPSGLIPFFQRNTGDDPLIGQDEDEPQHWPKYWNNANGGTVEFDFESAVTLKGGEYFFAPSKPFLSSV